MCADKTTVHDMPSSIVDAQLQRLLEIVSDFRQQQCDELLRQAQLQSRQMVRHTYHNARARLRNHILEDRQQLAESVSATRARRHTFSMQQKHQANRKFLNDSWELLKQRLTQRWQQPQNRQLWIQGVVEVALQYLSSTAWQIDHGKQWSASDKKQLIEAVSDKSLTFKELESIDAGILIKSGGATVDGTLDGLLSDRERIESEFLAQCTNCIVHGIAGDSQQKK